MWRTSATLAYLLKEVEGSTGGQPELARIGKGGRIIGKRCGWTQNLGQAAKGTV